MTLRAIVRVASLKMRLVVCFLLLTTLAGSALTNLVANGSFDRDLSGWDGETSVFQYHPLGYLTFVGTVGQDLNTVPGRDYVLRFTWQYSPPRVHWGDEVYDTFTNTYALWPWTSVYRFVRATTNITRLAFEDTLGLGTTVDNILVGWLLEPAQIIQQPQSRTAIEKGTVSFSVGADGGPPLYYQWFFNDQAIPDATGEFFIKNNVTQSDQGNYHVVVSNSVNAVTSTVARLTVDPQPTTPVIVLQPEGTTTAAGYGYGLRVVALGTPPLQYQWYLNNNMVLDATNAALGFPSIQETNQGTYFVIVSNAFGSVRSLSAALTVYQPTSGAGVVRVDTINPPNPVFDVDGITRIDPYWYTVQLYVGASPTVLRPVGGPLTVISQPALRGTYTGTRTVPDVPPGSLAYGQIRAWETAGGASYEEARARGARHGFSQVESVVATSTTPNKFPFKSFRLRYGAPAFSTGRLEAGQPQPGGLVEWTLIGEPGYRYLLEKNSSDIWIPLTILTNDTGRVSFVDPDQQSSSTTLYRSRILD